MSIRFTLPSAKNPSQRLSGDQNGSNAFSVPGQRPRRERVDPADPELRSFRLFGRHERELSAVR